MGLLCFTLGSDLQSVNDTRDVAQDRQENVDEEIGIATALEEDTKGWEDDGENDLADIAISHKVSCVLLYLLLLTCSLRA